MHQNDNVFHAVNPFRASSIISSVLKDEDGTLGKIHFSNVSHINLCLYAKPRRNP